MTPQKTNFIFQLWETLIGQNGFERFKLFRLERLNVRKIKFRAICGRPSLPFQ